MKEQEMGRLVSYVESKHWTSRLAYKASRLCSPPRSRTWAWTRGPALPALCSHWALPSCLSIMPENIPTPLSYTPNPKMLITALRVIKDFHGHILSRVWPRREQGRRPILGPALGNFLTWHEKKKRWCLGCKLPNSRLNITHLWAQTPS